MHPVDAKISLINTIESFRQAVERCITVAPKPISTALSGGFDSRTIWSVLHYLKTDIRAVTHGMIRGYDVNIAIRVAKTLGIEHDVNWIDETFRDNFYSYLYELVSTTNGMVSGENSHLVYVYRNYLGKAVTIMDGNHSNIEGRWALRNTARHVKNRNDFFEAFWKQIYRPTLTPLLSETKRKKVIEIARDRLDTLIPDPFDWYSIGCAADTINVMHLLAHHGTDAVCLQNHYNRYLTPYFDLDYVNEISKVPERLRWRQKPQYSIVKSFAPQLLRIPRCYSDVRTLGISNPYLLRIPVAWHRKVIPKLKKCFPARWIKMIDPYKPSIDYRFFDSDKVVKQKVNDILLESMKQSKTQLLLDDLKIDVCEPINDSLFALLISRLS